MHDNMLFLFEFTHNEREWPLGTVNVLNNYRKEFVYHDNVFLYSSISFY